MKNYLIIMFLFVSASFYGQKAEIKGKLTDETTLDPLAYATVVIKNSTNGVNTDLDGNYSISVEAGTYTIQFQYMGYITQEKTITLAKKETKTINVALASEHIELEGVVVEATRSKSRESALLIEQQRSSEIKQQIGSQELSRKGVSDVASAVAKTTGVSKQEGTGTIFVRGLG
ncbi:MAG: carboxypeptidase-like regulatory domain-containing protein, partial [Flavobacterium sp.]